MLQGYYVGWEASPLSVSSFSVLSQCPLSVSSLKCLSVSSLSVLSQCPLYVFTQPHKPNNLLQGPSQGMSIINIVLLDAAV